MRTLLSIIAFLIIASSAHALPSFQEVKNSYEKSDAVLLDRHGEVIHELRVDSKKRSLDWVSIKDVSPALINAVIHSEDRKFYEHSGVDWKAVSSAVIKNLFTKTQRGASTITMQLVTILDKKLKSKSSKKTLSQKWDQMRAAKGIEEIWTKEEIMEAYLNLVTFRGELQGISAASRGLFDKEPSGLDESGSFILASLVRSPNASVDNVCKRACVLSKSIKSHSHCEDIKILAQKTLSGGYLIRQKIALAPHAAYQLFKKSPQYPFAKERITVVSTLDGELQRFADEVLKYQITALKSQNVNDGVVLVVENKTGDVLAYVGGTGEINSRFIDGIHAKRQAGSTLKPFLYAIAFEKQILTPASILDDSPLDIPTARGIYKPENYENDFKGRVSARTALASSLNIPAVRTLSLVGVDIFVQRLKQLGFKKLKADDYYGLSLALGSADVSLWDMVNAYRTLANNGIWNELRVTFEKSKNDNRQVFSQETAFLVSNILSDREARSTTFGLENPLSTRFWSAVKTGTSKDMRDNWCIGYSQKYTVGVWVGNFTGKAMWNVSGVTGAAPVWLEIMNYLHHNGHSNPVLPPAGVIAKEIKFQNNIEHARLEWFIQGTEPINIITDDESLLTKSEENPHIIYPANGTIIALDPDIPTKNQFLFFEARTDNKKFDWVLNNEKIGDSNAIVLWKPKRGKYLLSMMNNQNNIVDSVTFEVRGAAVQ